MIIYGGKLYPLASGGSMREKCIDDLSTKYISRDDLSESYDRGIGAWKSNPSSVRNVQGKKGVGGKKMPKEQWACARAKKLSEKGPDAGYDQDLLKGTGVSDYSKKQAKRLGVQIKPSTKKNKKIDVYKDGKLVASVGAKGYKDFPTYLKTEGKKIADERKRLYKKRHSPHRHKVGTPSYYADQLLW